MAAPNPPVSLMRGFFFSRSAVMRTAAAVTLAALLVLAMGNSPAQQGKAPPAKADPVEELQAEALKNNTDIKVAEAKVRLAEAELEQVRSHLKAKVAVAYAEVEAARVGAREGFDRYSRALKAVQHASHLQ
jgi:outer membrane protein TolC